MMTNRIFAMNLVRAVALVVVSVFALKPEAVAGAAISATPTTFTVTVNSVELCTDANCTTAELLGDTPTPFNLASGSGVNASLQQFAPGKTGITPATYTHVRVVIPNSIMVEGTVPGAGPGTNGAGACFTDAVNGMTGTPSGNLQIKNPTGVSLGTMTYVVDPGTPGLPSAPEFAISGGNIILIQQLGAPLVVTSDTDVGTCVVTFSVSNALMGLPISGTDCGVYIGPPTVNVTIGVN